MIYDELEWFNPACIAIGIPMRVRIFEQLDLATPLLLHESIPYYIVAVQSTCRQTHLELELVRVEEK